MKARLVAAVLAPWRATRASRRWSVLAILAACLLGAAAIGVWMPGPRRWLACAVLYAVGAFFVWALWLSTTLRLAIDAYRMQLPGVQRAAIHGLMGYAALTVGLPVVTFSVLPNIDLALTALIAASACIGGLAFALLPGYVIVAACFLPALQSSLKLSLRLPELGLQGWLVATLTVLTPIIALRWYQLARTDTDRIPVWRGSLAMQIHWLDTAGLLGDDPAAGSPEMIRRRPDWLQPRAALGNAGPGSPVLALRIALGGHYLPQTLDSQLRTAALVLLPTVTVCAASALVSANRIDSASLQAILVPLTLIFIGGTCLLTGPTMALLIGTQLHQRWRRINAELPLLALPSGLGDARAQRRHLLHATLNTLAIPLTVLLLVALAAAWLLHLHGTSLLLVALPIPTSLAVIAMQVLRLAGGAPLQPWGAWLLFVPLTVLLTLSIILPAAPLVTHASPVISSSWLLVAWGVMTTALAWLIHRGWRAFVARPHPFLPVA